MFHSSPTKMKVTRYAFQYWMLEENPRVTRFQKNEAFAEIRKPKSAQVIFRILNLIMKSEETHQKAKTPISL